MRPQLRRFALTAHVTSSVGWVGAVAAFLGVAIVGLTSEDPQTVRGAYLVMEPTAWFVLLPFAFASLVTGIVISLGTRVLIIDDDERLNALLTEYLTRFGFSVHAVSHPDAGLRALKADPPDLLVLDVMLPDMDGLTVCRKVREVSRIPIIMLTARGDVADRIVGLELGADDVLVSRVRQKLGDDAKHPTFIRTVRGIGYSFTGSTDE